MLADEVTHVKMGSDWLRRLTDERPRAPGPGPRVPAGRRQAVLLGGFRGEDDDSPIQLARRFRELAGFADDEIDEIAELSARGDREPEAHGGRRPRHAAAA